jgi:hypothetical protein
MLIFAFYRVKLKQLTREGLIMAKILKVGVVGVGGIARMHMPGWELSPNAEVSDGL